MQQEQGGMTPPAGADAMDPTGAGGGNIGTGQAPVPGEQGFSARNDEQQGTTQQTRWSATAANGTTSINT